RLERQCRVGAREHDRDAARLRNELEGDLDQRADDAVPEQQPVKAGTMTRTSMRTFLYGAVAAIACAGCGGMPERVESWPAPVPVETAAATPTDGAIYRDSGDVRLFEDVRAARVGDVLTVRLIERTNATKNAATSTSKSSEAAFANPVVFG